MSQEQGVTVKVEGINIHQKVAIPLSKIVLYPVEEITVSREGALFSSSTSLVATANHPVMTAEGKKAVGDLIPGDVLHVYEAQSQQIVKYQVHFMQNDFKTVSKVYSLDVEGDSYLVNNVLVLEK